MSHLLEEYAKCCGVNIDKPIIKEHFYPVLSNKYITIDVDAEQDADEYPHWGITINLLSDFLKKEGIEVIQISNDSNRRFNNVDYYYDNCSHKNKFYILKKSLLHIGVNNISAHAASSYNNNILTIVGNTYPDCCKPYWSSPEKTITISPDFSDIKPSFLEKEPQNRIQEIKPEEIVSAALKLLKIKKDCNFKTINIGGSYDLNIVDFVPNFEPSQIMGFDNINIRLDKHHDTRYISAIMRNKRIEITTNKPIDEKILIKSRIKCINYIADSFDPDFVNKVKKRGIKMALLCSNKKNINDERFKFFEEKISSYDASEDIKEGNKKLKNINLKKVKTLSARKIFSNGKFYSSYYQITNKKNDLLVDLNWIVCYCD